MRTALCLALLAASFADAKPVVFHVSDPINPGETALLFGDEIGASVRAEGWRVAESGASPVPKPLQVLQASDVSVKVVIPKDWKPGLFAVRLTGKSGVSDVIYLNRTEPWWWIGGQAGTAYNGEEVRVLGKNFGPRTAAWLEADGKTVPLATRKAEKYALTVAVPTGAPARDYRLWVSNGFGGKLGHGGPLTVKVAPRTPWPTTTYDVRKFGAAGDGMQDDTEAIRKALAEAGSHEGGVVLLPRGTYKITGKLVVPPRTVLKGEKREWVWLFVPKELPELDAVIAGNRDFAVEELSVVSQTAQRLLVCPDQPALYRRNWGGAPPLDKIGGNARFHRLRLHHLHYAHRVNKGDPRRMDDVGPSTIALAGEDIELSDSEVVSSGMPIASFYARRYRIERNRLDTGRNGWYGLWDSDGVVLEGNIIQGRDLEASYGGFQGRTHQIYYANNILRDGFGGEREALTFDTPYAPTWMGRGDNITASSLTTREHTGEAKSWKPDEIKGETCLIAYGKGLGQMIAITGNTESTLTLEKPWAVTPDSSSHIVIRPNKSRVVITGNEFADASAAVQLYAQSYGFIIDGNKAERTGGMYGQSWDFWWEARKRRRYSTCMFNQWLNNDLKEGFIYQQGPWLHGALGPVVSANNGLLDPPAVTTIGNIIRNNTVRDNFVVGALYSGKRPDKIPPKNKVGYLGRDTIIEGNNISDSPVAIDIYPHYLDTVVRNNRIVRCPVPLIDAGTNTWKD